jgi:hypothetical protein
MVADFHSYYVGDLEIWTHNSCGNKSEILNWSLKNKKGETRVQHINKHTVDNKKREYHGVFNGNPTSTLNQAWNKVKKEGIKPVSSDSQAEIYHVPFKNAGRGGGSLDYGKQLDSIEMVIMKGTNMIITGYPRLQ